MADMQAVTDADFETEVLKSDKPVLVDFWAEWCGPCRQVDPILEEIADEHGEKLTFVKMNVDENPVTPAAYRVTGIPTLNVYQNGEVVKQIVGAKPEGRPAQGARRLHRLSRSAPATPAPPGVRAFCMRFQSNLGDWPCVCSGRRSPVRRAPPRARRRRHVGARAPSPPPHRRSTVSATVAAPSPRSAPGSRCSACRARRRPAGGTPTPTPSTSRSTRRSARSSSCAAWPPTGSSDRAPTACSRRPAGGSATGC